MPGKVNLVIADYGGEKSPFSFFVQTYSAAGFDAQQTAVDALKTAIAGICNGLIVADSRLVQVVGSGSGQATDPNSGREEKWLITYQDNTTLKNYQMELPSPLLTANTVLQNPEKSANVGNAAWTTFIAAFEAVVRSPDGAQVTFIDARKVGRNN